MTPAVQIEVVLHPALTRPALFTPDRRAAMEAAAERVRAAGERSVLTTFRPSNKANRIAKPGYGPLAGSLRTEIARTGAVGRVSTNVFYGRFLEYGAAAHVLAPKKRATRALMLPTPNGVLLRASAHHPGVRARHWLRGAATSEEAQVHAIFAAATQRWTDAVFADAGEAVRA